MIVVHISRRQGSKRVKLCDGTPIEDKIPNGNNGNKTLCENCRTTFHREKR